MILTKYRMIIGEGYIETLNEQEAIEFGNYIVINEEIPDEVIEQING